MAEFKIPKFVFKDKPISLDECYQELSEMSYESPVSVIRQGIESKIEGGIYEAILSYGVVVDKDELLKALRYDRDQYRKGFVDGSMQKDDLRFVNAAMMQQLWNAVYALADMVNQFAYTTKFRRKEALCDGGLSALENAFDALCNVGCPTNSNGTITLKDLHSFMETAEETKQQWGEL